MNIGQNLIKYYNRWDLVKYIIEMKFISFQIYTLGVEFAQLPNLIFCLTLLSTKETIESIWVNKYLKWNIVLRQQIENLE